MATTCEGNKWFWDYFTSENNIARCDICYTFFQITEVPKDNIMGHIETQHSVDYQRIVSSGNAQKDLESQLYIIQDNDMTCKFCYLTFTATNAFDTIRKHLEKTHKINEYRVTQICEWLLKYYFDESVTDMKRRCTRCNETILNKPLPLLSHLRETHNVDVPLKSVGNWVWEYYTKSEGHEAKCSVCSEHFVLKNDVSTIIDHIESYHGNILDLSKNSQADKYWPYSITENNQVKCDNCDFRYDQLFYDTPKMKTHLIQEHYLNKRIARKLCNWVLEYFHKSNLQTSKCSICENMFQISNPFNFMIHLKETHQVRVSPEIIPTRFLTSKNWMWAYYTRNNNHAKCSVCSKTYLIMTNIKIIINHIKMAHGNMFDVTENSQAYENWPYSITENDQVQCDNCNENYALIFYASTKMRNHLIKEHNINEEIARKLCNWVSEYFHISNLQTSKCNRCENVFRKSNFFNLMIHLKEAHQISVHPEIIPAGLSSELSSLLNPDRCAENNAPSTSCNQPSRNVDQSSDRDNLYEEIDNFSEMKTRLSSELSSIFNSDRHAENNAPSTTCNQPPRNADQSSDCDDRYDQINNPSEMETKSSSSELCSLFNSNRCAENNAPSTSNNQPPRNVDQSSDCDNHYVQIDNCLEIKTTRYKKWRKSRYY